MFVLKRICILFVVFCFSLLASCSDWDNIALPPDPGEAGKASLAGIDSNNNGVRDDVEIAIYYRYPKDKQMRQVCYQLAKTAQKILQVGAKETISDDDYERCDADMDRAVACLVQHEKNIGVEVNSKSLFGFIDSMVINTKERAIADQKFNEASNINFSSYDWDKPCDYIGN